MVEHPKIFVLTARLTCISLLMTSRGHSYWVQLWRGNPRCSIWWWWSGCQQAIGGWRIQHGWWRCCLAYSICVLLKLHVTYQSLERTNMVDKTTQVAVCYEIQRSVEMQHLRAHYLCFCSHREVRIWWWKDLKVLVAPSNTSNIWSGGTAGKILKLELNWTNSIDQGIDTSTKCGSTNWRSAAVDWSHRARWKNADTQRHLDKLSVDVLKEFQTPKFLKLCSLQCSFVVFGSLS